MSRTTNQENRRKRFTVDAFFTDTSLRAVGVSDLAEAKNIRLDRIEPDPNQPRKELDPEGLEELASSIRADGVLQPIAVRYDDERDVYVILHGERRWRASKMAGLEAIPSVVRDVPEERRLIQQLVENIVREDLNALDRAAALRALKAQMGDASWDQVAEAVGIRRSRLFQLLGTEKLDNTLQDALRRGIVSEKQTRVVQGLPRDVQHNIGAAILEGSLEPRMMEEMARSIRSGRPRELKPARSNGGSARVDGILRRAIALVGALSEIDDSVLSRLDASEADQLASVLRDTQKRIDDVLTKLTDSPIQAR